MWPIRGSLYAKGFLIVLLGSPEQCSRKALAEEESEQYFGEYVFSWYFVAFSVKCNCNYVCIVLQCLRAM